MGRGFRQGGDDLATEGSHLRNQEGWHKGYVQACMEDCQIGEANKDAERRIHQGLQPIWQSTAVCSLRTWGV